MNPAHVLVPALWVAWIVYWYAAARNAKATQRKEDSRSSISHQLPLFVGALLMAIPFSGPLGERFAPGTPLWQWIAIVVIALGLGFSALARMWLAGNWSSAVTVKQGHELIRSGPYAIVRHPIYTGLITALGGSALAVGKWRALIGFAVMTGALVRKLVIEERFMRQEFGEAYARYRAEVKALVPFVI